MSLPYIEIPFPSFLISVYFRLSCTIVNLYKLKCIEMYRQHLLFTLEYSDLSPLHLSLYLDKGRITEIVWAWNEAGEERK